MGEGGRWSGGVSGVWGTLEEEATHSVILRFRGVVGVDVGRGWGGAMAGRCRRGRV